MNLEKEEEEEERRNVRPKIRQSFCLLGSKMSKNFPKNPFLYGYNNKVVLPSSPLIFGGI